MSRSPLSAIWRSNQLDRHYRPRADLSTRGGHTPARSVDAAGSRSTCARPAASTKRKPISRDAGANGDAEFGAWSTKGELPNAPGAVAHSVRHQHPEIRMILQPCRAFHNMTGVIIANATIAEDIRSRLLEPMPLLGRKPRERHESARASCFWVYAYPAFLRYAAHSAGGYWARILPQASEIAS